MLWITPDFSTSHSLQYRPSFPSFFSTFSSCFTPNHKNKHCSVRSASQIMSFFSNVSLLRNHFCISAAAAFMVNEQCMRCCSYKYLYCKITRNNAAINVGGKSKHKSSYERRLKDFIKQGVCLHGRKSTCSFICFPGQFSRFISFSLHLVIILYPQSFLLRHLYMSVLPSRARSPRSRTTSRVCHITAS